MLQPEDPTPTLPTSPHELPPLAQLGAVTGRFIHDLANEISCAATVASLLCTGENNTPPEEEDLKELSAALERSSRLIHQFGATVRSLRPPPQPVPATTLLPEIQKVLVTYPTLKFQPASKAPYNTTAVICHPTWLAHCIDFAARAYATLPGSIVTLDIVPVASVKPPVEYYAYDKPKFYLKIAFIPPKNEIPEDLQNTNPQENLPLFITRELLRHLHGFTLLPTADIPTFSLYLGCS
jgi:hypothetical protein